MAFKSYKELKIWRDGVELSKLCYHLTAAFPKDEMYGLSSQIRRCSVSVPSNIAEGHARNSSKDFLKFISVACGSLAELETQLIISQDVGIIDKNKTTEVFNKIIELQKMLWTFRKELNKQTYEAPKLAANN